MKILICTDSSTIKNYVKKILENLDCEVFSADNEDEVWNIINNKFPDIIIVEDLLWNIDGYDLCVRIKKFGNLKTLFLLDKGKSEDKDKYYKVDKILLVPFSKEELLEAVENLYSQKNLILHIDDSQTILKVTKQGLTSHGYNVINASDGKEGLEILERLIWEDKKLPDLIISDIEMPNMDGYTFCKRIKSDDRLSKIPVILVSTLSSGLSIERGFESGADDYLTKPIVIEELVSRINTLIVGGVIPNREKIVIIDDNNFLLKMVSHSLRQQGFAVNVFKDGDEGIEYISNNKIDLIVINIDLVAGKIFNLIQDIKLNEDTKDTIIIVIIPKDSKKDKIMLQQVGVEAYLSKPFTNDRLLAIIEKLIAERHHQREINAMKLYMSAAAFSAAKRLAKENVNIDNLKLEAEERELTILFSDVKGFSSICERLSSREVIQLLNDYLDLMAQIIEENGGMIDKFIGDAILAIFDPLKDADAVYNACKVGILMQQSLKMFYWKQENQQDTITVRIGINTGKVIMGDLGSKYYRRESTVIGDNVNIAQRLESVCPPGSVLISESTYNKVKDRIKVEEVGPVSMKGKIQTVNAYLVKELL